MPRFKDYNQNQGVFRQLVPNELLEEDHPARIIDAVVERLNLERIYASYKDEGKPAYHPKMMLKVLFYSYQTGALSCRKMEAGLQMRADFVYLSGDQVPDFRTLNMFRTRHMEELPGLFAQIVTLCASLGMVSFKHLAIDGQKIAADANFRNTMNRTRAKKRLEKISRGMKKLLEEDPDEDVSRASLEKRARDLERKKVRLEQTLAILETLEDEKASINMVDAEAKIMSHKDRRILPSYNQQSAVDGAYGITCAVATRQSGDAPEDLFGLVDEARQNTGGSFAAVLADSGFCDYERLRAIEEEREESFYVPDKRHDVELNGSVVRGEYDKSKFVLGPECRRMICPHGQEMKLLSEKSYKDGHVERLFEGTSCEDCPVRGACTKAKKGRRRVSYDSRQVFRTLMRERLTEPAGREAYRRRQGIVEPVHGHDQKNLGWRQHHLRGLKKAGLEFLLVRLAGNIGKIARYKARELLSLAGGQVTLSVGI